MSEQPKRVQNTQSEFSDVLKQIQESRQKNDSYIELLKRYEISPKIIETQSEYEHFLTVTESLLSKRNERTEAEIALFMLLVKLIRDYEEKTYSFQEWINTKPHEFLQHLMEARELKQIELVKATGLNKGLVSAMLSGKREISKAQAKKLGEYFNVSPENLAKQPHQPGFATGKFPWRSHSTVSRPAQPSESE